MRYKRKIPMIKEYEDIYHDWLKEMPTFKEDTPIIEVLFEAQKALRRVMQGTERKL